MSSFPAPHCIEGGLTRLAEGRIADDILNVSKLSMGLLSINSAPFEMVAKLREILRMFDLCVAIRILLCHLLDLLAIVTSECNQKGIALRMAVGDSIAALKAQVVVADASRIAQILLNFLTNSKYQTLLTLSKAN
mgnify:CR=1 FL=1